MLKKTPQMKNNTIKKQRKYVGDNLFNLFIMFYIFTHKLIKHRRCNSNDPTTNLKVLRNFSKADLEQKEYKESNTIILVILNLKMSMLHYLFESVAYIIDCHSVRVHCS